MSNFTLPNGWMLMPIRETVVPTGSRNPKKEGAGSFRYVDVDALDNTKQVIGTAKEIDKTDAPSRARMLIKQGDVLFCLVRPYLKNIAIVPRELDGEVASTAYCVLRPNAGMDSRFLFYQIVRESFIHSIPTYGNSPPSARDDEFMGMSIYVAPLPEQRRIVAKIEELFSDLDAGVAALERVRANLKRYRAAVLKAAVEGRLSEDWRTRHPATEPAAKLLERILAERRAKWEQDQLRKFKEAGKTPPKGWKEKYEEPQTPGEWVGADLPRTWTLASIDQLSVVVRGGSPRPAGDPKFFNGTHTPWITVGTLTADEGVYLRAVSEYLTEAGRERSRYIEPDTLLLTNSGATLGVPKITMIGGCINDGSVALLGVDYPLKLYLHFFLKSQTQRLRGLNQGAAQPNLNTGIVKAIVVPLPPSAEQAEIAAEVDRRLSVADAAETQVEHALRRATRLRQAILKRAFEGKLVPQDRTDEPAATMLERAKATANGHRAVIETCGARRRDTPKRRSRARA